MLSLRYILDFSGNLVRSEHVRKASRQGISKKTCASVSEIQQACFFAYNAVWKPCSHVQYAASYRKSLIFFTAFLLAACATNQIGDINNLKKRTQEPSKQFKINFDINPDYDAIMIFNILNSNDPAGLESRARDMGIDLNLAKKIKKAKKIENVKTDINKLISVTYSQVQADLLRSVAEYAKSWESIILDFTRAVYKLTDHYWFYDQYICFISPFHGGVSNWYGNIILRHYKEDPIIQRRITAYEIVLSHIFHIVRKYYSKDVIDDMKVWAFAEITTTFILNEKELTQFWKWFKPPLNYFSKSNYPQLANIEDKLKVLYKGREDFKSYIIQAVKFMNTE